MGSSTTGNDADRVSAKGIVFILSFLALAGNVRASYAEDTTEANVGLSIAVTVGLILVVIIKWTIARRREVSRTWPYALVTAILVCLVVVQASFIANYQPWYDRVTDEQNAKPPFEYYIPVSQVSNQSVKLWGSPIEDLDATYFNGSLVVVYSYWESDRCYLKVLNTTELDRPRKGKALDFMTSIPRSRWDYNIIYGITLVETNGTLVCYYTLDEPGGLEVQQTRMVSTTDGWNWTERTIADPYVMGPATIDVDVPPELSDFGWTAVESHISFDLDQDGFLLVVRYGGGGLDHNFDRGTFFAHSWDGKEWSDLVLPWDIHIIWSWFELHRLEDGRYLGLDIYSGVSSTRLTLFEFEIDHLYEVDGPYSGR